jgi:Flp pilus assembly protein TadD
MSGATAIAAIIDENYPEAISWAEKALVQNRRFAVALRVLAVALVKVGQRDRAAQVVQELLTIEPELTISGFSPAYRFLWNQWREPMRKR